MTRRVQNVLNFVCNFVCNFCVKFGFLTPTVSDGVPYRKPRKPLKAKKKPRNHCGSSVFFLAEKEGFEPCR